MTIQEERSLLEAKLEVTSAPKEQAEVILEILRQYSSIYNGNEDVYVKRLLKLSVLLKDRVYKAWLHYYKANILWASGSYDAAFKENKKALALFTALNNTRGTAYANNLSGKIFFRQGNYAGALSGHSDALKLFEETGDKYGEAKALSGLGITYLQQRNFAKALSHLMSALRIREEIGDLRGIANSRNDTGLAYLNQNNYPEALSQHLTALKIREELDDKEGLADSYENIGMVYRRQENYPEALSNFFACLRLREETHHSGRSIEDKPGKAAVYNMIGVIYTLQGNYTSALSYLGVSLRLNEEIGFKEGIARAQHNLGRVHYELKDYPQALAYSKAGLKILEEINSSLGICGSNIFLGKVYTSLKEYELAAAYLTSGTKTAGEMGNKSLRKEALESWYQLKKAEGDSAEALAFHEQFTEAEKELNNEESNKKITSIQYSYQIEKKEQEITFERQKKEALQAANELLAKEKKEAEFQQKRAEHSEHVKQMFLADMSHEIRTPMNAIMGMTNLLLSSNHKKKDLGYLQAIKHSADSLLVVINDILDLSKIEAGKMALENIPFDLKAQLKTLEQMFDIKARENKIRFFVRCEGIPELLTGDPNRLNQVLINLLGNAFKFTNKGSVALIVKQGKHNLYHFSVTDTGIGIDADKLELIFENFSQADSGTTRKYGGTGLGLTISKQLVELMGGKITVKSKPGKGSDFSFTIAFKPGPAKSRVPVTGKNSKTPAKDLTGLKILLGEDNKYNQVVAVEMLKKLIYKPVITVANNGKEVLQKFKKNSYDIIFMDLHMPVMDGYEATGKIRTGFTGKKKNIPIVALTASVLKADLDSCIKCGMNGYVNKPFLPEELLAEIYRQIRKEEAKTISVEAVKNKVTVVPNKGPVNTTYLKNLTGGKASEMTEYINIFLKFVPGQIQQIENAVNLSDKNLLYKALHSLKPQLKIMGVQNALQKTELLETDVKGAEKLNSKIKASALIVCRDIKAGIKYWSKIKETLN